MCATSRSCPIEKVASMPSLHQAVPNVTSVTSHFLLCRKRLQPPSTEITVVSVPHFALASVDKNLCSGNIHSYIPKPMTKLARFHCSLDLLGQFEQIKLC